MLPSILIQAWQMGAEDLGIEIMVPDVPRRKGGGHVQADLLVKDFGPTLVATETANNEEELHEITCWLLARRVDAASHRSCGGASY